MTDISGMTMTIRNAIIPFLPIYIFGIFLNMAFAGEVFTILTVFIKIIGCNHPSCRKYPQDRRSCPRPDDDAGDAI